MNRRIGLQAVKVEGTAEVQVSFWGDHKNISNVRLDGTPIEELVGRHLVGPEFDKNQSWQDFPCRIKIEIEPIVVSGLTVNGKPVSDEDEESEAPAAATAEA